MKTLPFLLALFIFCPFAPNSAEEKSSTDRFTPLFDGKTLQGWRNPYTWGKVEVVNGEIHLTADKKFFLVTEKTFGDFILKVRCCCRRARQTADSCSAPTPNPTRCLATNPSPCRDARRSQGGMGLLRFHWR